MSGYYCQWQCAAQIQLADIWPQGIYTSSPALCTLRSNGEKGNRGGPKNIHNQSGTMCTKAMGKRAIEVSLLQLLQLYHGCWCKWCNANLLWRICPDKHLLSEKPNKQQRHRPATHSSAVYNMIAW